MVGHSTGAGVPCRADCLLTTHSHAGLVRNKALVLVKTLKRWGSSVAEAGIQWIQPFVCAVALHPQGESIFR